MQLMFGLIEEADMINRITRETWEQWYEEIIYIIQNNESDNAANNILNYLQDEGAFTVVDDESNV